jgi:hypothetical protein
MDLCEVMWSTSLLTCLIYEMRKLYLNHLISIVCIFRYMYAINVSVAYVYKADYTYAYNDMKQKHVGLL